MGDVPATAPFPATSQTVFVPGPTGPLEVLVDYPDPEQADDSAAPAVGLICAGSAKEGATLHNKVVQIIERSFRELGAVTVRFNFRGCGESPGEFDQGYGETEDLLAMHDWVRRARPDDELWLGGYRFGAFVAQRACGKLKPGHLVSVSPPLAHFDFAALEEPACPWLIVGAALDEEVAPDQFQAWTDALACRSRAVLIEDADETYHRRLMDLRGVLKNGIRRVRTEGD